MNKIVIAGASVYGLNNLSDDSMFYVFCRGLRYHIPDLDIILLARHPSLDLNETYGLKSIKNMDFDSKEESIGNFFRGLNRGDSTDHLKAIWEAISRADLLVIGGGPFIDISIGLSKGLTPYVSLLVTVAKFVNTPVMMNGIHLGRPLETDLAKEMTRFCVSNSITGTLREEKSRKLFQDIGVPVDRLITTADAGFGLDPVIGESAGREILRSEGIQLISPNLIGVTFRYMYWLWGESERENYSTIMAQVCDYMAEEFEADIIFLPHCFYSLDHKYEDDRPGADEIILKMNSRTRAHAIKQVRQLYDILSIYPLLDMIVGNRRHSLIFGAIHGVAGVGLGEIGHIKPIVEQLHLDPSLFISNMDYSYENIKNSVATSWENRAEIVETMNGQLPILREKAFLNAKVACEHIIENQTEKK
jgi:colanic acid/amylovoran biosynthesis protein